MEVVTKDQKKMRRISSFSTLLLYSAGRDAAYAELNHAIAQLKRARSLRWTKAYHSTN